MDSSRKMWKIHKKRLDFFIYIPYTGLMLIEFKAANFKSIRGEQTLSMVASNSDKTLSENLISTNLPGLKNLRYLKGAAIYGANASGKSNVLEAVRFLADFVKNSATRIQPGDPTGTIPFKLDLESKRSPSRFEITFVTEGVRYLFGLAVDEVRVYEEFLVAYPKGVPQHWYHRRFDHLSGEYKWSKPSSSFDHDPDLQKKTRDNSLFLSVGPQFNHPQLVPVYKWFSQTLQPIPPSTHRSFGLGFTMRWIQTNTVNRDKILSLLRSADVGISDFKILEKEASLAEIRDLLPPTILDRIPGNSGNLDVPGRSLEVVFGHNGSSEGIEYLQFPKEESGGTIRFFSLIGPWIEGIENSRTTFIDEVETSLHPLLVRELLRLLMSEEHNPCGAQVIFTTHNPILLDSALLRRDQVWFTEKTADGATHLYPLTDYRPRKDEALAKGYLAGRYGGIPYLPAGLRP